MILSKSDLLTTILAVTMMAVSCHGLVVEDLPTREETYRKEIDSLKAVVASDEKMIRFLKNEINTVNEWPLTEMDIKHLRELVSEQEKIIHMYQYIFIADSVHNSKRH